MGGGSKPCCRSKAAVVVVSKRVGMLHQLKELGFSLSEIR